MSQGSNVPQLGIRYIIEGERQAVETLRRIEQQIKRLEQAQRQTADAVVRANQKRAQSSTQRTRVVQRNSKSTISQLVNIRRQIITLSFFFQQLAQIVKGSFELIGESADNAAQRAGAQALAAGYQQEFGNVIRILDEASESTLSTMELVSTAQRGFQADLGEFATQYGEFWETARVVQAATGEEAVAVFESILESLSKADGKILDSTTTIFQAQGAVHAYAESAGVLVEDLEEWEKQQAILNRVQEVSATLIANGAGEVSESEKSIKQLQATWTEFKDVLGLVIGGEGKGLQLVNRLLTTTTQILTLFSSVMENKVVKTMQKAMIDAFFPLAGVLEEIESLGNQLAETFGVKLGAVVGENIDTDRFKDQIEALGIFVDEPGAGLPLPSPRFVEPEKPRGGEGSIEPILRQIKKREEIIRKHQETLRKLEEDHQQKLADIERRAARDLARARRTAQRDRARAIRQNERKVFETTRDFRNKMRFMERKHAMDMRQDREKFNLQSLQDQRLYEYERSLLVAQGDVLAIEDLDARHALEQQARQEDFSTQQRQDEENFQLRLQKERESFAAELDDLAARLDERLLEISIREQESIDDITERRRESIIDANADYERQRNEELANQELRLQQWREYWDVVARQTKVGLDQITEILDSVYGPGGEAIAIIEGFQAEALATLEIVREIEAIIGRRTSSSIPYRGRPEYTRPTSARRRQFGGDEFVTKPTLFMAGETPERVTTQPLNGGRTQLSLAWSGGPIPLEGRGELGGANFSGLGDSIAQGIVTELTRGLLRT